MEYGDIFIKEAMSTKYIINEVRSKQKRRGQRNTGGEISDDLDKHDAKNSGEMNLTKWNTKHME